MKKARHATGWLPGIVFYGALLVVARLPHLFGDLLFLDDYGLLAYPDHDLTTGRFPLLLEMLVVEGIAPGFSLSGLSPWVAALYLGLAAESIRRLARDIDLPAPVALVLPVPFLVHPCTNELLTWSVTRATGFCLFASVQGYRSARRARRTAETVGPALSMIAGTMGYEVSCLVPAAFATAEAGRGLLRGDGRGWKACLRPVAVIVVAIVVVVLAKSLWRGLYPGADPRGALIGASTEPAVNGRLKIASNVLSNLFLSPLSYYVGFERAGRAWKWLPAILLVTAGTLWTGRGRRAIRGTASAFVVGSILATSVLPALLLPGMNDSWRISVPGAIAFSIALAVAAEPLRDSRWGRGLVVGTLAAVSFALVAPGRYYLGRRIRCNAVEVSAVDAVREFWRARGIVPPRFGLVVVPFPEVLPWDPEEDSRVVTEGFVPVTTSSLSAFKTSWFANQLLVQYNGLGVLSGDRWREAVSRSEGKDLVKERRGFVALAHDVARRVTVIRLAEPGPSRP